MRTLFIAIIGSVLASTVPSAAAAPDDWAEGLAGQEDGANRTYYNSGGQLPWRNREGDWRDAAGVQQGEKPFAAAAFAVGKDAQAVEWDVTELAREWGSGKIRNKGLLLRNTKSGGNYAGQTEHWHTEVDTGVEVTSPRKSAKTPAHTACATVGDTTGRCGHWSAALEVRVKE